MIFKDISHDNTPTYTLNAGEQHVFFLLNRSDDITFELSGMNAVAHVFAFFIGKGQDEAHLTISQRHLAPHTTSRVLVKSVLDDSAHFSYRGTLHIAPEASLTDASQENRNLLLSHEAQAFSEPALEILTSDVKCHHAAATGPLNHEALFFAQARGLSKKQAENLLVNGFLRSSVDVLGALVSRAEKEKVLSLIGLSS